MHRTLVLGAAAAFSSALLAQSPAAAEPFTYANGDLSAVGVAGSGWDAAEGGWQVGDTTAAGLPHPPDDTLPLSARLSHEVLHVPRHEESERACHVAEGDAREIISYTT